MNFALGVRCSIAPPFIVGGLAWFPDEPNASRLCSDEPNACTPLSADESDCFATSVCAPTHECECHGQGLGLGLGQVSGQRQRLGWAQV